MMAPVPGAGVNILSKKSVFMLIGSRKSKLPKLLERGGWGALRDVNLDWRATGVVSRRRLESIVPYSFASLLVRIFTTL